MPEHLLEDPEIKKLIENIKTKMLEKGVLAFKHWIPGLDFYIKDKDLFRYILNIGNKLAEKGIDPRLLFVYGVREVAGSVKDKEGVREIVGLLYKLNVRMLEKGMDPGYLFVQGIPEVVKVVRDKEELRKVFGYLGHVIEKSGKYELNEAKFENLVDMLRRVLEDREIKREHLDRVLELKREMLDRGIFPTHKLVRWALEEEGKVKKPWHRRLFRRRR